MPPATKNNTKAPKVAKNKKVVKTAPKTVSAPVSAPTPTPTPVPVPTPVLVTAPVTTEAPVVSDTPYLEEFTSVITELDNALTTIRNMKSRIQKLEKQVHKDHKAALKKINGKRARKPRDPNAPKSGFAKEGPVSTEMGKFLGLKKDELISRTDVTKKIHLYCKAKDLQNPADKRHIKADAPLRKLLKMNKDDDLTFFNLQKYMKVHFPNKEGIYPTA
jgi:hypothetical protein